MKWWQLLAIALIALAPTGAGAADPGSVPTYTAEDLDRMFGPAPERPSDPVDKSRPEDWQFVEQFLERQYSRIDADRSHDLRRRTVDIAENRVAPVVAPYPYGAVSWGLGYPAATWWQTVWSKYSGCDRDEHSRHAWRSQMPIVNREPRREPRGRRR